MFFDDFKCAGYWFLTESMQDLCPIRQSRWKIEKKRKKKNGIFVFTLLESMKLNFTCNSIHWYIYLDICSHFLSIVDHDNILYIA